MMKRRKDEEMYKWVSNGNELLQTDRIGLWLKMISSQVNKLLLIPFKQVGNIFSNLLQYQVIGWLFPISTPPLYYAGTKIKSDPKPCQGLDKAVIKMTEYE